MADATEVASCIHVFVLIVIVVVVMGIAVVAVVVGVVVVVVGWCWWCWWCWCWWCWWWWWWEEISKIILFYTWTLCLGFLISVILVQFSYFWERNSKHTRNGIVQPDVPRLEMKSPSFKDSVPYPSKSLTEMVVVAHHPRGNTWTMSLTPDILDWKHRNCTNKQNMCFSHVCPFPSNITNCKSDCKYLRIHISMLKVTVNDAIKSQVDHTKSNTLDNLWYAAALGNLVFQKAFQWILRAFDVASWYEQVVARCKLKKKLQQSETSKWIRR